MSIEGQKLQVIENQKYFIQLYYNAEDIWLQLCSFRVIYLFIGNWVYFFPIWRWVVPDKTMAFVRLRKKSFNLFVKIFFSKIHIYVETRSFWTYLIKVLAFKLLHWVSPVFLKGSSVHTSYFCKLYLSYFQVSKVISFYLSTDTHIHVLCLDFKNKALI